MDLVLAAASVAQSVTLRESLCLGRGQGSLGLGSLDRRRRRPGLPGLPGLGGLPTRNRPRLLGQGFGLWVLDRETISIVTIVIVASLSGGIVVARPSPSVVESSPLLAVEWLSPSLTVESPCMGPSISDSS